MERWIDRWAQVDAQIAEACASVGRPREAVRVIAVSKYHSIAAIEEAYAAGHRDFGESRLQEALPKIAALPQDICWHYIGPLQSNKAKRIAESFQVVHSLENERQLREIAKQSSQVEAFLQVNLSQDPKKSGIFAEGVDAALAEAAECSQVRVVGLMGIAPQLASLEESRSWFQSLFRLAQEKGFSRVSMGMSSDFVAAIQEGATDVRIGSALFGDRPALQ